MIWLLCDYGEVLSLAQPAADQEALEAAARPGMPDSVPASWAAAFWARYSEHRPDYDRGDLTVEGYWTAVLGSRPTPGHLETLIERDTASWLHPNEASLAATSRAARRGLRLALFSNAPVEVAAAVERRDWASAFSPRLFSCRLRAIKPEPAAYAAVLDALGAPPGEVMFLDDRPENVAGARQAGMRAEVFTDPAQIDALDPR